MRLPFRHAALVVLLLLQGICLRATDVLFIGNSFTFRPDHVTAPGGVTGVAALFGRLAAQGGRDDIRTRMITRGGQSLRGHLDSKATQFRQPWDIVVLQDHSTRPAADTTGFLSDAAELAGLLRQANPDVAIHFYETWAYPARAGDFGGLESMQARLSEAYAQAAAANLAGLVPVGRAFALARAKGATVWDADDHHQNPAGAYLSAVLFYHALLGGDIGAIPAGEGSVAARIGLTEAAARLLHQAAAEAVAPAPAG